MKEIFETLESLDELQKSLEVKLAYTEKDAINNWDDRIEKLETSIYGVKYWRALFNTGLMDAMSIQRNSDKLKKQTNF